jgi:hypothetical protein
MKKLIPLMLGMALTFGAITTFAAPQTKEKSTKTKSTKAPKKKATKS